MGGLGPMARQNSHFNVYASEKVPYENHSQNLSDFPNLKRWFEVIKRVLPSSARM